jgi:hypothetical protein
MFVLREISEVQGISTSILSVQLKQPVSTPPSRRELKKMYALQTRTLSETQAHPKPSHKACHIQKKEPVDNQHYAWQATKPSAL